MGLRRQDEVWFDGSDVCQSPDMEVIGVSLTKYVHKIKPLSMEKVRKNMQDDKEHRLLRVLVGAMSWPVSCHNQHSSGQHQQADREGHA